MGKGLETGVYWVWGPV